MCTNYAWCRMGNRLQKQGGCASGGVSVDVVKLLLFAFLLLFTSYFCSFF